MDARDLLFLGVVACVSIVGGLLGVGAVHLEGWLRSRRKGKP